MARSHSRMVCAGWRADTGKLDDDRSGASALGATAGGSTAGVVCGVAVAAKDSNRAIDRTARAGFMGDMASCG